MCDTPREAKLESYVTRHCIANYATKWNSTTSLTTQWRHGFNPVFWTSGVVFFADYNILSLLVSAFFIFSVFFQFFIFPFCVSIFSTDFLKRL